MPTVRTRSAAYRLSPAFARHHVQSIKARGDQLFGRRVTAGRRQQIAGQLFERELIERLVSVERIDHVVAIGEDALVLVTVVADRVRKPDDVQPGRRHSFAEVRRIEQSAHLPLVGSRVLIVQEVA